MDRAQHTGVSGFTLVELMVALAVGSLLLCIALPSFAEHWRQARRSDAVVALTRVQMAQEQYRAEHGSYALTVGVLRGASMAHSDNGWYDIVLDGASPHGYQASAVARAGGSQADDHACPRLSLQVNDGLAQAGPSERCWNR